jgi:hypothetical protein
MQVHMQNAEALSPDQISQFLRLCGPGRLAILEQIDRSRRQAHAPGDRIVIDWVETLQGDWLCREQRGARVG